MFLSRMCARVCVCDLCVICLRTLKQMIWYNRTIHELMAATHVLFQATRCTKTLLAHITFIRFLFRVNTHVDFQFFTIVCSKNSLSCSLRSARRIVLYYSKTFSRSISVTFAFSTPPIVLVPEVFKSWSSAEAKSRKCVGR